MVNAMYIWRPIANSEGVCGFSVFHDFNDETLCLRPCLCCTANFSRGISGKPKRFNCHVVRFSLISRDHFDVQRRAIYHYTCLEEWHRLENFQASGRFRFTSWKTVCVSCAMLRFWLFPRWKMKQTEKISSLWYFSFQNAFNDVWLVAVRENKREIQAKNQSVPFSTWFVFRLYIENDFT